MLTQFDSRNTLAGCFATTLGAAVHELGHTFDLGHTDTGVMSNEFNAIDEFFLKFKGCPTTTHWWTLSAAAVLSHHKWFNNVTQESTKESVTLIGEQVRSTNGIKVIEYRARSSCELVSHQVFNLPTKIVKLDHDHLRSCSVLVMDTCGNTFKLD